VDLSEHLENGLQRRLGRRHPLVHLLALLHTHRPHLVRRPEALRGVAEAIVPGQADAAKDHVDVVDVLRRASDVALRAVAILALPAFGALLEVELGRLRHHQGEVVVTLRLAVVLRLLVPLVLLGATVGGALLLLALPSLKRCL
jgi:hypothetical protein